MKHGDATAERKGNEVSCEIIGRQILSRELLTSIYVCNFKIMIYI